MNATTYTSSRAVITDDAKRIALIKARIAALLAVESAKLGLSI